MAGRDVPDMRCETVVRIQSVEAAHRPVANDFRDDRGGCDRGTLLIAVHDRFVLGRGRPEPKAVNEARLRGRTERRQSLAEAAQVGFVQPVAVDGLRGNHPHRNARRATRHRPEKHFAPLLGHLLRVVQESKRTNAVVTQRGVVEENTRDNQRPREAAPTGLVRAGDEPRPEAPIKSKKSSAGPAHGFEDSAATCWPLARACPGTNSCVQADDGGQPRYEPSGNARYRSWGSLSTVTKPGSALITSGILLTTCAHVVNGVGTRSFQSRSSAGSPLITHSL